MTQHLPLLRQKPDFSDDVSGLIYGYRFVQDHAPESLTVQQSCEAWASGAVEGSFLWLHVNLNHALPLCSGSRTRKPDRSAIL